MQLERHLARQHGHAAGQGLVQDVHAVGQGLKKALFLGLENLGDALLVGLEFGVGLAHQRHQVGHQLVEKRRAFAQLVAMADGAAHDAALHIAAPLVGRHHAVADQKSSGADVVGNHAQALVAQVGAASLAGGGADQGIKQIDLVIAVHVLQNRRQPLQPHAGVHTGRWQRQQAAVSLHVELHEHVVPDLDVAVAILLGTAGRAARHLGAVVVKNL